MFLPAQINEDILRCAAVVSSSWGGVQASAIHVACFHMPCPSVDDLQALPVPSGIRKDTERGGRGTQAKTCPLRIADAPCRCVGHTDTPNGAGKFAGLRPPAHKEPRIGVYEMAPRTGVGTRWAPRTGVLNLQGSGPAQRTPNRGV